MKCIVTYISSRGQLGNVVHSFEHDQPSETELEDLNKRISDTLQDKAETCIVNWNRIYDDTSEKDNPFAVFIDDVKIKPADLIEVFDENGGCIYQVEFGQYKYQEITHLGWYLKINQVQKEYPADKLIRTRPIMDLSSDRITSFRLVK